jgi:hypothetical protein
MYLEQYRHEPLMCSESRRVEKEWIPHIGQISVIGSCDISWWATITLVSEIYKLHSPYRR